MQPLKTLWSGYISRTSKDISQSDYPLHHVTVRKDFGCAFFQKSFLELISFSVARPNKSQTKQL